MRRLVLVVGALATLSGCALFGSSQPRPGEGSPALEALAASPPPKVAGTDVATRGNLQLIVEPKDADVYVDGVLQGLADDFDGEPTYLKVEPGLRRVELRKAGFKTWRMELQVDAQGRQTITAKLSP